MCAGRLLGPVPEHGTRARYVHRTMGCNCELCKAANARAIRAWRRTGSTHPTQDTMGQ